MLHPITLTLATAFLLGAPPLHGIGFARRIEPVDISVSTHHPHAASQHSNPVMPQGESIRL